MKLKNDPTAFSNWRPPRPGVKVATITSSDPVFRPTTSWYAASRTMTVVLLVEPPSRAAALTTSAGIENLCAPDDWGIPAERAKSVGIALIRAPSRVLRQ